MSIETMLNATLAPLVADEVYPDVGGDEAKLPYITYSTVGGQPVNFVDGALPDRRNARVQINVWAETRLEASALAEQVEGVIRQLAGAATEVLTSAISTYDEETKARGTRQDFSIWY